MIRKAQKRHLESDKPQRRRSDKEHEDSDEEQEILQHVLGSKKSKQKKGSSEILLEKLVFGRDIEESNSESDDADGPQDIFTAELLSSDPSSDEVTFL